MSNFYEIAESLPGRAPNSLHPGGSKDKAVDNLIQRAISSAGRVKDNMVFSGVVLYCTMMPQKVFQEKFWPDIVNYVLPKKQAKQLNNSFVTEMYVYVHEICGCLPRPDGPEVKNFYEALGAISPKTEGDAIESLAKDDLLKDTENAQKYLKMIKRFPKVYSNHFNQHGDAIVSPGSTVITVKFPYKYDTSIGVQVANSQK